MAEFVSRAGSFDETRGEARTEHKPGDAVSWHEELVWLGEELGLSLHETYLKPGWQVPGPSGKKRTLEALGKERDRLLVIRNGLGWLSVDAAARFDRRLGAASDLIDAENAAQAGRAALKLGQAEHVLQLAWWSTHWNRWKPTRGLPLWAWVTVPLVLGLGATVWAIFDQALYPPGGEVPLRTAFFGAALWGLGGGLVNGLRTVHLRVQGQEFERDRIAWYGLSPILGLAFGAIVFLLFIGGLLSTGQKLEASGTGTGTVDPTPILLLAVLAGFAQNAFISALQQIISAQFRGAAPEEEKPV
jgi:hypothetical protein